MLESIHGQTDISYRSVKPNAESFVFENRAKIVVHSVKCRFIWETPTFPVIERFLFCMDPFIISTNGKKFKVGTLQSDILYEHFEVFIRQNKDF